MNQYKKNEQKKAGVQCNRCLKRLCNGRSLRNHQQKIHGVFSAKHWYSCEQCNFTCSSLSGMTSHAHYQHGIQEPRFCVYCVKMFAGEDQYTEHLNIVHSLPNFKAKHGEACNSTGVKPTTESLNGTFRSYKIDIGSYEIDLLAVLKSKRDEIDNIVRLNTQTEPLKLQFSMTVELSKPYVGADEYSQPETITIYLNSKTKFVDFDGLPDNVFYEMVDEMLTTLNNFSSHGSGWTVEKYQQLEVRCAKTRSARGSSYLNVPGELKGSHHLLNIRNQDDEKCFLYCFTAQYHLQFGPALTQPDSNWRVKTSPSTYDPDINPQAKSPNGEFDMPMGFSQMKLFEQLNRVRVNVFR